MEWVIGAQPSTLIPKELLVPSLGAPLWCSRCPHQCLQSISWLFFLFSSVLLWNQNILSLISILAKGRDGRGEKEVSWEEKTAGAMEGIWGQVLWAVKQWDEMKAFQKELDAAPHTPTPQPTNSTPAPRRKIKITFCGMKRGQWLRSDYIIITWEQPFHFRAAKVLNHKTHITMWEIKQIWTQTPVDISFNIKEGIFLLLFENKKGNEQVLN